MIKYINETLSNGNEIKYKVINETCYHIETPSLVVDILEASRQNKTRLKLYYGDTKTGVLWGDVVTCRVGRSTGRIKIPLAIKQSRSMGGEGLLDHCIVKITSEGKTIYSK